MKIQTEAHQKGERKKEQKASEERSQSENKTSYIQEKKKERTSSDPRTQDPGTPLRKEIRNLRFCRKRRLGEVLVVKYLKTDTDPSAEKMHYSKKRKKRAAAVSGKTQPIRSKRGRKGEGLSHTGRRTD